MHWIKLCTFSFLWNYSLLRLQLILVVLYRLTLPRFFFFLLCNCTSFLATVFVQQLRPYFSIFCWIVLSFFLCLIPLSLCLEKCLYSLRPISYCESVLSPSNTRERMTWRQDCSFRFCPCSWKWKKEMSSHGKWPRENTYTHTLGKGSDKAPKSVTYSSVDRETKLINRGLRISEVWTNY